MTISIIRHTKVYNPENICYGQQDIELASSFVSDATHIVSYCQNKSKSIIFQVHQMLYTISTTMFFIIPYTSILD